MPVVLGGWYVALRVAMVVVVGGEAQWRGRPGWLQEGHCRILSARNSAKKMVEQTELLLDYAGIQKLSAEQ